MAKVPLKLSEMIDADPLRAELTALTAASDGDGSSPEVRARVLDAFRQRLAAGRATAEAMLMEDGSGTACAARLSHLMDELIAVLFDFAVTHVYRSKNPSAAERMAIVAVGGYGRGTLAPGSDIDLLFLLPYKQTPWGEQIVEYMLYMLWDLGLKVGHATRNIDECIRLSGGDITIRTSILEARFMWGDKALCDELMARFDAEVLADTAAEYVQAKLAERDDRHARAGESRYLVEPNVKDGKGGLRDLHTLFWIGKYVYRVRRGEELVDKGVFTRQEYLQFRKAEDFLWAVRCHMHFLTGKAEERLHFDIQRDIAERLGYTGRPGLSAVERFMKHYFLTAKSVGDLTRILCAALEEEQAKQVPGFNRIFRTFSRRRSKLAGTSDFVLDNHRINIADDQVFERDPVNILQAVLVRRPARAGIPPRRAEAGDALAEADRPHAAPRRRGQPAVHGRADVAAKSRTQHAPHERGGRARQAHPRLRQDRRDDAVQHVSPLHGRRAPDPLHRRTVGDRAGPLREAASAGALADAGPEASPRRALRGGSVPRHRQGASRGPFRGRRPHRPAARPAHGVLAGGYRHRRLAGRAAPDHVDDGADARPQRPQDDRGLRQRRAVGRAHEAASGADRLRHTRGGARGLERLEGPAPAQSLLRDRTAPDRRLFRGHARPPRRGGAQASWRRRCRTGASATASAI